MSDYQFPPGYEAAANELRERIERLIPDHPEILEMESPWDLFKVPDFKCDDLDPSMAQAQWAFGRAKMNYQKDQSC